MKMGKAVKSTSHYGGVARTGDYHALSLTTTHLRLRYIPPLHCRTLLVSIRDNFFLHARIFDRDIYPQCIAGYSSSVSETMIILLHFFFGLSLLLAISLSGVSRSQSNFVSSCTGTCPMCRSPHPTLLIKPHRGFSLIPEKRQVPVAEWTSCYVALVLPSLTTRNQSHTSGTPLE